MKLKPQKISKKITISQDQLAKIIQNGILMNSEFNIKII